MVPAPDDAIAPVSVTASHERANASRSTAVEPAVPIPLMGRVPLVAPMKMDRMSGAVLGDRSSRAKMVWTYSEDSLECQDL